MEESSLIIIILIMILILFIINRITVEKKENFKDRDN